ncbi:MAG: sigma-70 family RNA polymerase sigma factor [Methyloprofundus sp.]|nr:sigma-70 family RNA polymerase sigma factor [Methyloprofundus sp.]
MTLMIKLETLSDVALIALIADRDQLAFNLIMQRHLAVVLNFCQRYLKKEAEDIAQETFIKLWNNTPNWEDKGFTIKAWLLRVSYHLCIDELRKNNPSYLVDEAEGVLHMIDNTTEQLLSSRVELQLQMQALNQLPERQRSAILLCACNGLNVSVN